MSLEYETRAASLLESNAPFVRTARETMSNSKSRTLARASRQWRSHRDFIRSCHFLEKRREPAKLKGTMFNPTLQPPSSRLMKSNFYFGSSDAGAAPFHCSLASGSPPPRSLSSSRKLARLGPLFSPTFFAR